MGVKSPEIEQMPYNRSFIQSELLYVALFEKLFGNEFGYFVLDGPRFGNGTHVAGCHHHAAEH